MFIFSNISLNKRAVTPISELDTGRGKSGGDHIFVNPELSIKPCLVVIIKISVHHIKFGKGLTDHQLSVRRRGHLVLKTIVSDAAPFGN